MERRLQKFHVARHSFLNNGIAHHAKVGKITCCPKKYHLQAFKNQDQLARENTFFEFQNCSASNTLNQQINKGVSYYLGLYMLFSLQQFEYFCTLH